MKINMKMYLKGEFIMKKALLLTLLSTILSSCLIYKESDLDPNKPFATILGLLRLSQALRPVLYEVPMKLLSNGLVPVPLTVVRVMKMDLDYVLPNDPSQDEALVTGMLQGSFYGELGTFPMIVKELGRYRLDIYQIPNVYIGTLLIEIPNRSVKIPTIIDTKIPSTITFEFLPIQTYPDTGSPILSLPYNIFFISMGEFQGKAFFICRMNANERFYVDSFYFSLEEYLVYFWTEDGIHFESQIIRDIPFALDSFSLVNLDISNAVEDGDKIHFIVSIYDLFQQVSLNNQVVTINASNPKNYSIASVIPRNPTKKYIEAVFFYKAGNYFYYQEKDEWNNIEIRRETTPFQSPTTNEAVDINDINSPFYYSGSLSSIKNNNNYVLYQSFNNIYFMNPNGSIGNPVTISHNDPYPSAGVEYIINPYRSFYYEDTGGSSLTNRVSTSPNTFSGISQTFSDPQSILITKPNTNTNVGVEIKYNSNFSLVQVFLEDNINNVKTKNYYHYSHGNSGPTPVNLTVPDYLTIDQYKEEGINFNSNIGLVQDKIIQIKSPFYEAVNNSILPNYMNKNYLVYTVKDRFTNNPFPQWKKLDLKLDQLPPLLPQQ